MNIEAIKPIVKSVVKQSPAVAEKLSNLKFALPAVAALTTLKQDTFESQQNYDGNPYDCFSAITSWTC